MTLHPESIPTTWTSADETFFRVSSDLFSHAFVAGAGVLLASYDDDTTPVAIPTLAVTATPAAVQAPAPAAS